MNAKYFFIDINTAIDNGISGHLVTLGGLNLGQSNWLLKSSMGIEQLGAALIQSNPDKLEITELRDQREVEALKLNWLGHAAATAPPLEDFVTRMTRGIRQKPAGR